MLASFGHKIPHIESGRTFESQLTLQSSDTHQKFSPDSNGSRVRPALPSFYSPSLQSHICKSFLAVDIYSANISSFINKRLSEPSLCNMTNLSSTRGFYAFVEEPKKYECTFKDLYLWEQSFAIISLLSTYVF